MPILQPLTLVTEKHPDADGRHIFEIDPDICWPATLLRIQEMIASPALPIELYQDYSPPEIDPRAVARDYQSRARQIPAQAWELALLPRQDPRFLDHSETSVPLLALRRQALELIRLWFTQALHVAIDGAPMGVIIFNRSPWRS